MKTIKYFSMPFEPSNLKAQYKMLCKKLHPDCGGNHTDFVEMKAEYDFLINCFGEQHQHEENTYDAQPDLDLAKMLDSIIHLPLVIEIIGTWIWLSGDTYAYKEILKEKGFKFSGNKKMWYWHHETFRKKSKKNFSIDEIREMFDTHSHNSVSKL